MSSAAVVIGALRVKLKGKSAVSAAILFPASFACRRVISDIAKADISKFIVLLHFFTVNSMHIYSRQEFRGMPCRTCFVSSHYELNESISMTHIVAKFIGQFVRYCLFYIFAIISHAEAAVLDGQFV